MNAIDADVAAAIRLEGREAFVRFGGAAVCPYQGDARKTAWYEGFNEAKKSARAGYALEMKAELQEKESN